MERAVKEAYAKRDITDNADLNTVSSPTMSDLVEILQGIIGGESLAQRLYKYTDGTLQVSLTNAQTSTSTTIL